MKLPVFLSIVILSALPLFAASVGADSEIGSAIEAKRDANASKADDVQSDVSNQAARFAISYASLRQKAATDENAARGFFVLAGASILNGRAVQEYRADLHGLLDQLGEDHFAAILVSSPVLVRDDVLRTLSNEIGYDEPEADTSDFSRFYPVLDRMIRSVRRESPRLASSPDETGAASAIPSSQSPATQPSHFEQQEAMAQVSALPEVQAYGRKLIHETAGEVKATIQATKDADGICVSVGEDHDDHTICWTHFRVSPKSREISAWSEANGGEWIGLAAWRRESNATRSTEASARD